MTTLLSALLVFVIAAVIARPLLDRGTVAAAALPTSGDRELWEHEKSIALTAIKEAEFDHATGKLSQADYEILRATYEERALAAIGALDELGGADETATTAADGDYAPFCGSCGRAFEGAERFCPACGAERQRA